MITSDDYSSSHGDKYSLRDDFSMHDNNDDILYHFAACQIQAVYRGHYVRCHSSVVSQLTVLAFDTINKKWVESNCVRLRGRSSCATSVTTDVGDHVWCDNDSDDDQASEFGGNVSFRDVQSPAAKKSFMLDVDLVEHQMPEEPLLVDPLPASGWSFFNVFVPSPTAKSSDVSPVKPSPADSAMKLSLAVSPRDKDTSLVWGSGAPSFEHWTRTAVLDSPTSSCSSVSGNEVVDFGRVSVSTPSPVPSTPASGMATPTAGFSPVIKCAESFDVCAQLAATEIQAMYRGYFVRSRVACREVAHLHLWSEAIAEMRSFRRAVDEATEKKLQMERLKAEKVQTKRRFLERQASQKAEKAKSKRQFLERRRAAAEKQQESVAEARGDVAVGSSDVVLLLSPTNGEAQQQHADVATVIPGPVSVMVPTVPKSRFPYLPLHSWEEFLAAIDEEDFSLHCAAAEIQALFRGVHARQHHLSREVAHITLWREALQEMRALRQQNDRQVEEALAAEAAFIHEEENRVLRSKAFVATRLQAIYRGYQTRRHIGAGLALWERGGPMAVRIQARFRGVRVRLLLHRKRSHSAMKIQAMFRGWIVRKPSVSRSGATSCVKKRNDSDGPVAVGPVPTVPKSRFPYLPLHSWEEFLAAIDEEDFSLHCAAAEIQALFRGVHARQHHLSREVAHITLWKATIAEIRSFRAEQERLLELEEAEARSQAVELTRMRAASVESRRYDAQCVLFAALQEQSAVFVRLQAVVRGALCRSNLRVAREARIFLSAARKIQARFRGCRARAQWVRAKCERILMEFESELAVGAMRVQFGLEAYMAAEAEAEAVYNVEVIRLENESEAYRLAEEAVVAGDRELVRERAAGEDRLTAMVGSEVVHILLLRSLGEEEPLPEPLLWAEEEAERLGEEADALTERHILLGQDDFCGQKAEVHRSILMQKLDAVNCEQARWAAAAASAAREKVIDLLHAVAPPPAGRMDAGVTLPQADACERAVAAARMNCKVAERETRHLERQLQVHRAVAVSREEQALMAKRQAALMAKAALAVQCCARAAKAWRKVDSLKRARRFEEEEQERFLLEEEALRAAEAEALEYDTVVEETIRADQTSFCTGRHSSHRAQLLQKIEAVSAVRERVKLRLLDEAAPLATRQVAMVKPVELPVDHAVSENAPVSTLVSTVVFDQAVSRAQALRDAAAKELLRLARQKSVHVASVNARAQREVNSKLDQSLQKQSARRIQSCYRSLIEHRRRMSAAEAELMVLTLRIQMAYRSYKARCVVARLRFEVSQLVFAKQVRHTMLIKRLQARFRRRRARRVLESEAAVPIQCMYRCFKARRVFGKRIEELEMLEMDKQVQVALVVSRLQAQFRGRKARRELVGAAKLYDEFVQQELAEVQRQQEELAATHIQAAFRGYEIRNYFRSCIHHAMSASFMSTSSGGTNISSLLSTPKCDEADFALSSIPALGVLPADDLVVLEQQRLAHEAAASVEQAKLELEKLKREKLKLSKEVVRREKARLAKRFRRIRTVKRSCSGKVGFKDRPDEDLLVTETDEF